MHFLPRTQCHDSRYVAFLMNEHETTHPVLVTFCRHLLLDSAMRTGSAVLRTRGLDASDTDGSESDDADDVDGTGGEIETVGGRRGRNRKRRNITSNSLSNIYDDTDTDDHVGLLTERPRSRASARTPWEHAAGSTAISRAHRVRTRWNLALTLTRNPQLIRLRKHHLEQDQTDVNTRYFYKKRP